MESMSRQYNIFSKLNLRKANEPDCLPNWLLKSYAKILARPICSILNSSLLQQKLPSTWKQADVIPVPKQKPITIINKHLRPISLTPTVSKVAEEFVVSKYIVPAVLEIIDPNQYEAIPKSSTIHAYISMIHQWAQATDGTGSAVRVILFDYKKGFWPDRPSHPLGKNPWISYFEGNFPMGRWFSYRPFSKSETF